MKYLVETHASIEAGNALDEPGGTGATFAQLALRFKPEAVYGNPTRRQAFVIIELGTEADVAELKYVLTWATGNEPVFTPIMPAETMEKALEGTGNGRPWA